MDTQIRLLTRQIKRQAAEIKEIQSKRERFSRTVRSLNQDYLAGGMDYARYSQLQEQLMQGASESDMLQRFDMIIKTKAEQISKLNDVLFSMISKDRGYMQLQLVSLETPKMKQAETPVPEPAHVEQKGWFARLVDWIVGKAHDLNEWFQHALHRKQMESIPESPKPLAERKLAIPRPGHLEDVPVPVPEHLLGESVEVPKPSTIEGTPVPETEVTEAAQTMAIPLPTTEVGELDVPVPVRKELKLPRPKLVRELTLWQKALNFLAHVFRQKTLFEKIEEATTEMPEELQGEKVGTHSITEWFAGIFKKFKKQESFLADETQVSPSILKIVKARKQILTEGELEVDTTMLRHAAGIRRLFEKKKIKAYKPSSIGYIANMTVRRLALYFINNFPDFFRNLYNDIRLSNLKILSNTYINIMFLMTIIVSITTGVLVVPFYLIQGLPPPFVLGRALAAMILGGGITFIGFSRYPAGKIKTRRRSINTNLPFAINHMSAVASSGVPPAKMFALLGQSKEYGEISVEIGKVVDYTEVFGYDFLTAIKAVSEHLPSQVLREFFEGIVATVESGGDLNNYLEQKAEEATLTYKLERQKYVESLSTYSDIYTGVLIAAPLFFVSSLSLVSMLGGAIGGMSVEALIGLGTYVVIPLLNIAFMVFLELSQPEV